MTTTMRAAFERVYGDKTWHNGSGPGSGTAETAIWREFLTAYMNKHDIQSVLDLGCGDWQWASLMDWRALGADYHGIDVVPSVIEINRGRHAAPGITFECADINRCNLPAADLIICKEVLQHWPLADIAMFRRRVHWRPRVLVVNDYVPMWVNPDIRPGGYRPLDFSAPPLNWPVREVRRWVLAYPNGATETKVVHEL